MTADPHRNFVLGTRNRSHRGSTVKEKLLAAAERLLQTHRPNDITTTMILREAGVARGSLYHHFDSQAELLESAMLLMFSHHVTNNIQVLDSVVNQSRNRHEFLTGLKQVTQISQAKERRASRFARIRLIAAAEHNPRLEQLLAKEQTRLTRALTKIIDSAKTNHWIHKDIPSAALAVFIQSYTLGKVVDDLVAKPIDPSDWNNLIGMFVERTLTKSH